MEIEDVNAGIGVEAKVVTFAVVEVEVSTVSPIIVSFSIIACRNRGSVLQ